MGGLFQRCEKTELERIGFGTSLISSDFFFAGRGLAGILLAGEAQLRRV